MKQFLIHLFTFVLCIGVLFLTHREHRPKRAPEFSTDLFAQALEQKHVENVSYGKQGLTGKIKPEFSDKYGGRLFKVNQALPVEIYDKLVEQRISQQKFFGPLQGVRTIVKPKVSPAAILPQMDSKRYGQTEAVSLRIEAMGLEAGSITLVNRGPVTVDSKPRLRWEIKIKTDQQFAGVYQVDNHGVTYADPASLLPTWYEMLMNESNKYVLQQARMNHRQQRKEFWASGANHRNGRVKQHEFYSLRPDSHNLISALFFVQAQTPGQQAIRFNIQEREKNFDIELLAETEETIFTPIGPLPTTRYKVSAKQNGQPRKLGKTLVWLSRQPKPVLVRLVAQAKIGSLKAEITQLVRAGKHLKFQDK